MEFENKLDKKIDLGIPKEKMPKHIAIILDGNRRFAKRLSLDLWKGHEWGEKKVQKLLEWCYELEISELTLYAFSMQNFNRPKIEFDYLMNLFKEVCKKLLIDKRVDEYDLKIRFIGRIELFDEELQDLMNQITQKTKNNSKYILNMAMAYGGREELTDAIKSIANDINSGKIESQEINELLISNYLYMKDEPDLIIRTGGELRTSNFLPWQGIYSEWFFLEKYWPEFEKEDLINCIKEYSVREIRRGK
ncbi:MAG: polyprenyl diphosphate synthase [Candidatus Woesearchaeota archaeon]|jgi:tritrans,polycis-undecaprenyl-diphosphate synthase [geranylgeranyl-diphosphate specific]